MILQLCLFFFIFSNYFFFYLFNVKHSVIVVKESPRMSTDLKLHIFIMIDGLYEVLVLTNVYNLMCYQPIYFQQ